MGKINKRNKRYGRKGSEKSTNLPVSIPILFKRVIDIKKNIGFRKKANNKYFLNMPIACRGDMQQW